MTTHQHALALRIMKPHWSKIFHNYWKKYITMKMLFSKSYYCDLRAHYRYHDKQTSIFCFNTNQFHQKNFAMPHSWEECHPTSMQENHVQQQNQALQHLRRAAYLQLLGGLMILQMNFLMLIITTEVLVQTKW